MQADILLYNGDFIQVERPYDPALDALVINDGIIAAIGRMEDVTKEYRCRETLDLEGRTVVPGFIDAHVHFIMTGLNKTGVPINGTTSKDELLLTLKQEASLREPGTLLFGSGYDESIFLERTLPTCKKLDAITSKHPVWLSRVDCHSCLLNSLGFEMIHLPENMEGIEYLEDGNKSGLLRGPANTYARSRILPSIPNERKREALELASEAAIKKGITTIHALEGGELFPEQDILMLMEEKERLPLDILIYYQTTDVKKVKRLGLPRIGGCIMLDGSIGSSTAAISQPFEGDLENRGILYFGYDELLNFVEEAHREGLQIATHVIGDRAIEQMLKVYEEVLQKTTNQKMRHRLEHFELPVRGQMERAARLGLIISMQPAFDYYWGGEGRLYEQRLGVRQKEMNPLKSVWERGIDMAGGSDSDVTPMDPILGIHAAVNHTNPSLALTVEEALSLFTYKNAFAAYEEERKGGILEGKLAHLVVLSENPLNVPQEDLKEIEVEMTLFHGNMVYSRL